MSMQLEHRLTVAIAGNPNVGKSTLFNTLTGLHQHTGNWPGKTVGTAQGTRIWHDTEFTFLDLPGTYSLTGSSQDEQVAAECLASGEADCTLVVCDGSCLERSLLLALQILQRQERVVVCINLMDEAQRCGIAIDAQLLARYLQAPVILTAAGRGEGIAELLSAIRRTALSPSRLTQPSWEDPVAESAELCRICMRREEDANRRFREAWEKLLVSRRFGVPLMFLLLFAILCLTVWGANYPSALLEAGFSYLYRGLEVLLARAPAWLRGLLLDGLYATSARVIAVMLPPMAIFFPLFTVLEDIGYLPRMAFLLDPCMARCGGCGKQALTLCMGLGCNAVGVMGCRIIDSPRERLAAILTNAMVPCNGRFPTLILLGSIFFPEAGAVLVVAACVALGVVGALGISGTLTATVLRSRDSAFVMEMPPFRRPRLGQVLLRSLLDKTLRITARALKVAAPAGAVLWILSYTGLLPQLAAFLNPVGLLLGMNGVIVLAFLCSLPANELLVPVILMVLTGSGILQQSLDTQHLLQGIMTWQSAACTMVFTLFHWPCSTTLMTIYRETHSLPKTAAAALLPTAVGTVLCLMLNLIFQNFGA